MNVRIRELGLIEKDTGIPGRQLEKTGFSKK